MSVNIYEGLRNVEEVFMNTPYTERNVCREKDNAIS